MTACDGVKNCFKKRQTVKCYEMCHFSGGDRLGGFWSVCSGGGFGLRPSLSFPMYLAAQRSPAFPPIDEPLAKLAALPWQRIASVLFTAFLFTVATVHAVARRLWLNRGRLAPLLRSLAAALEASAAALPEPLSEHSPRAALIAAITAAEPVPSSSLPKASRSALIRRARRLSLFA